MFIRDLQSPAPGHRQGVMAARLIGDLSTTPHGSTAGQSHAGSPEASARNRCINPPNPHPVT